LEEFPVDPSCDQITPNTPGFEFMVRIVSKKATLLRSLLSLKYGIEGFYYSITLTFRPRIKT
jgi:hypothetical protein